MDIQQQKLQELLSVQPAVFKLLRTKEVGLHEMEFNTNFLSILSLDSQKIELEYSYFYREEFGRTGRVYQEMDVVHWSFAFADIKSIHYITQPNTDDYYFAKPYSGIEFRCRNAEKKIRSYYPRKGQPIEGSWITASGETRYQESLEIGVPVGDTGQKIYSLFKSLIAPQLSR